MNELQINNHTVTIVNAETLFCTRCVQYFRSKSEFQRHIDEHVNILNEGSQSRMRYIEPYICTQCDKTFAVQSLLIIHYNTECLQGAFMCKHCKENCYSIEGLRTHLIYSHRYTPNLLEAEIFYRDINDDIMENFSSASSAGSSALNHDIYEESSQFHTEVDTVKTYVCDICQKSFSRKCVLNIHLQKHLSYQVKVQRQYKALKCYESSSTSSGNNKKKNKKNQRSKLKGSRTYFSRRSSTRQIKCTDILEVTEKYSGVQKSTDSHFNDIDTSSWKKIKVKRITYSEQNVARSSKTEKKSEIKLKRMKTISSKRKTCQVRNTDFFEILKQQTDTPDDASPLPDNIDTTMKNKTKLKRKVKRVRISNKTKKGSASNITKKVDQKKLNDTKAKDEGGKIGSADNCVLKGQYSRIPKATTQLSCEKTTSLQKNVKMNQKIKLKSELKNASDHLQKASSSRDIIKASPNTLRKKILNKKKPQHRKVIQKSEVKTGFTCETCKKQFKDGYKFRRHVFIHSGKRPYTCEKCKKTFARDDHLKRHFLRVCNKIKK